MARIALFGGYLISDNLKHLNKFPKTPLVTSPSPQSSKMAAKLEETSTAPAEDTNPVGGASSEKQPETVPAPDSAVKQDEGPTEKTGVEDATAGVADLSVADKETLTEKTKEDAAAVPAASTPPPTNDSAPPTTGLNWPETSPDHPLTKFYDAFEALVTEASHNEVYGIELTKSNPFHTKLILQKFLRANQNDLEKAKQQLLDTLKWRKEFDPTKAASESFEKSRFDGLGYVVEVEGVPESPNTKDIVTFNIYGAVKDNKATFGDLDGYVSSSFGALLKSHAN